MGRPLFFQLWFLSSFFLAYSQRSNIGCLPYFYTWCGLSAEFRMLVWTVLHAGRWKYKTQKIAKKSLSVHRPTKLSGYIFAIKACIDNRKKLVKQQYLLNMSSQYGELQPTNGWDRLASLGHVPNKFQRVSHLRFLTPPTSLNGSQPNFARCLAISWAATLCTFLGALALIRNSSRCHIHIATKSCVLLYWQRYCITLEQCASSKLCGV